MFRRILVANRGEIACRVMKTAQALGVDCVAVYSDVDAQARHVSMADVAVPIGGAAPRDSYLRGDAIIEAALRTGAEAIHPGYGFLSENPEFVADVVAAGLVFIGPSEEAIRAMGLKDAAKRLMEDARVPVVPGYHGPDQSTERLAQAAADIGYPVLIKAVAGGGGKGMRQVEDPEHFAAALASARSEAQNAFGNSDVLVEKYVNRPRHIEVQVFGDGTRAIHLFERDCSLQRRHQKVIEEAPAPGMTEEMRAAMGAAAVRAAEAIGYRGAGTVEFIADSASGLHPDRFYFMEMNTRLQVEHPVTEAITGIDLVEWQLRVAAGAPLPAEQGDIDCKGHAIEARLYAEDVPAGFLPATGRISHLRFPDLARADSGVRAGDEISPHYDPMIAKLIVHGSDRAEALRRMQQALASCEVAGTVTNLAFLGALMTHEPFGRGAFDTGLIARDLQELVAPQVATPHHFVAAAMAVTGLDAPPLDAGFALWEPLRQRVCLLQDGARHEIEVEVRSATLQRWFVGGESIEAVRRDGGWFLNGQATANVSLDAERVTVFDRFGLVFDRIDPLAEAAPTADESALLTAPMPGLIKDLAATPGQAVRKGARLAVLEAMKMEHALFATRDGEIAEVLVAEGDQVTSGAPLIRLTDPDD
ncbi:MAG: biotin carboxylase N-terminal domain-containing protein [Pseudomonadota bacterium]